jgi:hypothetical protein
MTTTEQQLIGACMEIGGIPEANGHFTAGLARRIEATGKSVDELTVGELLRIINEHREWFNEVHAV